MLAHLKTFARNSRREWTKQWKTFARRWPPPAPDAPRCTCWMRSTWITTARRCRLNQIAQVHAPEPQLITIQPFDPTALAAIEKGIRTADLGLNPMNDGKIIRVPVPPLTEERRKDMVKHLNKMLEEHRTAVRNIRRDGNDAIKKAAKDKKIAEDDEKRAMDEIQKLTDGEIKKMEEMSKAKEKEVMEI